MKENAKEESNSLLSDEYMDAFRAEAIKRRAEARKAEVKKRKELEQKQWHCRNLADVLLYSTVIFLIIYGTTDDDVFFVASIFSSLISAICRIRAG